MNSCLPAVYLPRGRSQSQAVCKYLTSKASDGNNSDEDDDVGDEVIA